MKKQKTLFVTRVGKFSPDQVLLYGNLPYTKVCLLYNGEREIDSIKLPANIIVVQYTNLNGLNRAIMSLYREYMEYMIIPYFSGDSNSKYSIKMYNKSFNTKIDPKIFKQKDAMMHFLWDIAKKEFMKVKYKDIYSHNYEDISQQLWKSFIIKPINASSSVSTFKISSWEDFSDIKRKLSRKYDYILEEYIEWELFSMDIYFDGKNAFLLSYLREIPMIELADKNKFSAGFLEEYWEEIEKHFNFIIPIRYNISINKLSTIELDFIKDITEKLNEVWYRGPMHLEYKYDKTQKKIGFIEWGARYGWKRTDWMKKIYYIDAMKIPYYLLVEKDTHRFTSLTEVIFVPKEQEGNLNIVWCKTNFIETTNYITILKKAGNILSSPFEGFLKEFYKRNFNVSIKEINFFIKYTSLYNFFPFYKNNETRFDYMLELNNENFELFKKKKFKIIEKTFFHDYK